MPNWDAPVTFFKSKKVDTPINLREQRICRVCDLNKIETEYHFLPRCSLYKYLRIKYNFDTNLNSNDVIATTQPSVLGRYIFEAFNLRKLALENPT